MKPKNNYRWTDEAKATIEVTRYNNPFQVHVNITEQGKLNVFSFDTRYKFESFVETLISIKNIKENTKDATRKESKRKTQNYS